MNSSNNALTRKTYVQPKILHNSAEIVSLQSLLISIKEVSLVLVILKDQKATFVKSSGVNVHAKRMWLGGLAPDAKLDFMVFLIVNVSDYNFNWNHPTRVINLFVLQVWNTARSNIETITWNFPTFWFHNVVLKDTNAMWDFSQPPSLLKKQSFPLRKSSVNATKSPWKFINTNLAAWQILKT